MGGELSVDLLGLLANDTCRAVLEQVDEGTRSVSDLASACDVSEPTMYRLVNEMCEHDLISEKTKIDQSGTHLNVYRSNVEHIQVDFDPSRSEVEVEIMFDDRVGQFMELWSGLRNR